METLGNTELIDRHRIGFLAGSRITALSVLPALDWASDVAVRDDVSIVSGFHSELERQVLDFLLQGRCGIVCVLARSLYSKIPNEYKRAFNDGRVLFVTEEKQNRASKESAYRRNKLVATLSDELVIPAIWPGSSICAIVNSYSKPMITLQNSEISQL